MQNTKPGAGAAAALCTAAPPLQASEGGVDVLDAVHFAVIGAKGAALETKRREGSVGLVCGKSLAGGHDSNILE
jgi:hypothetical protein